MLIGDDGELIGTMLLVLLGDGVVANVLLEKSKGQNSGWIVIAAGWGFAVAIAVYVAGWASGACTASSCSTWMGAWAPGFNRSRGKDHDHGHQARTAELHPG